MIAGNGCPVAGLIPLKSPCALRRGRQQGGIGNALANSEAFVLGEEKRPVAAHRPTEACAKLILAERWNGTGGIVKIVLGIKRAVAKKLISRARESGWIPSGVTMLTCAPDTKPWSAE